jgi:N-acetylneuraminic acid mutarotase
VGWTDTKGNLWLFGGYGAASAGQGGQLNDLWKFSGGEWTWVSGSNLGRQSGVYGVQGIAASGNVPGARESAVSWTDAAGDFWLFGGLGYDSAGSMGELNDLWKYGGGQWTWVSGSNLVNQRGAWGVVETPAHTNVPSARDSAQTWVDLSGNLWLFGGNGTDSTGSQGQLNDLWVYEP